MKLTKAQYEIFKKMLEKTATIFYWDSYGGSASLIWKGKTPTEFENVRVSTVKALLKNGFIERLEPNDEVNYYIKNYPPENYPTLDPRHYGISELGFKAMAEYVHNIF